MSPQAATLQAEIETPTGKGSVDENFPVGSWLVPARLRGHVMAYYAFARAADDIADNPDLPADEKLRRLDLFEAGLDGPGPAVAMALGQSLAEASVTDRHARDLLAAFRQDARISRYQSWDDLIAYCRLSADPVGRFLMDLHGEDRGHWPAAEALSTVLQILNHLQDCQEDYRRMDRVYLPLDMLAAQGLAPDVLDGERTRPGLRLVFDDMLARCEEMLLLARARPVRLRSRRLHAEMVVITSLAGRLIRRLAAEDPLAGRVKLSRLDFIAAGLRGMVGLVRAGTG